MLYRTAEWERLKGNKGGGRTGRRREKRDYKEERRITEVEEKRAVNKKKGKEGEDWTVFSIYGVAQPFLSAVLYVKKGIVTIPSLTCF
jgi:hypothetical protein